jgi:ubiquinone/menaquinone biosynthesis C-methylase UbiE
MEGSFRFGRFQIKNTTLPIMAKDAFRFSGEGAINYDRYLGPLLFEPYALDLASKIDASNLSSSDLASSSLSSVLEIACGTGRVTRHLRRVLNKDTRLVATDFNADMLQVAKSQLEDLSIDFQVEDAQNLSFPENSFDLVVCQFGLMFLKDKPRGLSEALRVLKPGGTFIFTTWDKTDNIPLLKLLFNDLILPCFKDEDTSRFLIPFSLFDPPLLEIWMKEANFSDVTISRVTLLSHAPTPQPIIDGFFLKHSLGKEVLEKSPADFNELIPKMEEQIIRQFGSANISFDLSAFYVSGKK